ncbi:MAG TPA: MBL fold metallo-hydrolase [Candidatus Gallacutalibacter pullistercoris]|nr:MBL fold metallo-hydrolase [Candidatus Gallacutalibacter pullistercoris]
MAELLYQGHGSYRIDLADGRVLYVDPFAGEGYDKPADWILVTHEHGDHNCVELPARKPGCRVITEKEALAGGVYQTIREDGLTIQAVEAYNKNHDRSCCVGYVLTLDGVKVYASGDTSETRCMHEMHSRQLDYALYPIDGVYNMDAEEASRCAQLVGARHSIPIHTKPGVLFDRASAEKFHAEGRIILAPGETLLLK